MKHICYRLYAVIRTVCVAMRACPVCFRLPKPGTASALQPRFTETSRAPENFPAGSSWVAGTTTALFRPELQSLQGLPGLSRVGDNLSGLLSCEE